MDHEPTQWCRGPDGGALVYIGDTNKLAIMQINWKIIFKLLHVATFDLPWLIIRAYYFKN